VKDEVIDVGRLPAHAIQVAQQQRRDELAQAHELDRGREERPVDRCLAQIPMAGHGVGIYPEQADAASRPRSRAEQHAGASVADRETGGFRIQVPDALNVITQEGPGELRRTDQGSAVLRVQAQVRRSRLDRLEVPHTGGRHVKRVDLLEA
jgi:hypothetical protein